MGSRNWFHSNLTGAEAERLLKENGLDGCFLVRPSASEAGGFCLSLLLNGGQAKHIRIDNTGEFYEVRGASTSSYATLPELIDDLMTQQQEPLLISDATSGHGDSSTSHDSSSGGSGECRRGSGNSLLDPETKCLIQLKYPIPPASITSERWYHGNISGAEAESLLLNLHKRQTGTKGGSGVYLVRESRHSPGSYVLSVLDEKKVSHFRISLHSPDPAQDPQSGGGGGRVGGGQRRYVLGNNQNRAFNSLSDLIEHYKSSPIVDEHGRVIDLKQPYNTSKVSTSNITKRITDLGNSSSSSNGPSTSSAVITDFPVAPGRRSMDELTEVQHRGLHSGGTNRSQLTFSFSADPSVSGATPSLYNSGGHDPLLGLLSARTSADPSRSGPGGPAHHHPQQPPPVPSRHGRNLAGSSSMPFTQPPADDQLSASANHLHSPHRQARHRHPPAPPPAAAMELPFAAPAAAPVAPDIRKKSGFLEEFEILQLGLARNQHKMTRDVGNLPINRHKNRYKNILPFDESRVRLRVVSPSDPSDYINANFVEGETMERSSGRSGSGAGGGGCRCSHPRIRYIAAQGCLPTTVGDFWRMIYQERCRVIIMVTKEIEKNKTKCSRYWPTKPSSSAAKATAASSDVDPPSVKKADTSVDGASVKDDDSDGECEDNDIKIESSEGLLIISLISTDSMISADFIRRHLRLTNPSKQVILDVFQYCFSSWPDHGAPANPSSVLNLLSVIHQQLESDFQKTPVSGMKEKTVSGNEEDPILSQGHDEKIGGHLQSLDPGPILLHCSAGIGRTGTLIAIDMLRRQILQHGINTELDILGTVQHLRQQRSGMVQTEAQYRFIYMAMQVFIEEETAKRRRGSAGPLTGATLGITSASGNDSPQLAYQHDHHLHQYQQDEHSHDYANLSHLFDAAQQQQQPPPPPPRLVPRQVAAPRVT